MSGLLPEADMVSVGNDVGYVPAALETQRHERDAFPMALDAKRWNLCSCPKH